MRFVPPVGTPKFHKTTGTKGNAHALLSLIGLCLVRSCVISRRKEDASLNVLSNIRWSLLQLMKFT